MKPEDDAPTPPPARAPPKYALRYADDGLVEVGLDEAGRGALWGRLYVGAVALPDDTEAMFDHGAALAHVRDSKSLSARKRAIIVDYVKEVAVDHAVAWAEAADVDRRNVLQADLDAMHAALNKLSVPVQRVLVDGDVWRPWCAPGESAPAAAVTLPDGDASYLPIAAASVLAKVAHDAWVAETLAAHPELEPYGFARNMGYGTAQHIAALNEHGPTPLHRHTFAPVREAAARAAARFAGHAAHAAHAEPEGAAHQEQHGALPEGVVRTWGRGATPTSKRARRGSGGSGGSGGTSLVGGAWAGAAP
jgi:ribonuclease HII